VPSSLGYQKEVGAQGVFTLCAQIQHYYRFSSPNMYLTSFATVSSSKAKDLFHTDTFYTFPVDSQRSPVWVAVSLGCEGRLSETLVAAPAEELTPTPPERPHS